MSAWLPNLFVGRGAQFTGVVAFHGVMQLEGSFSGRINSPAGTLMVNEHSELNASIEVATAEIYGTVKGAIAANECVLISRSASVAADIRTPSLIVEEGAIFEGRCQMSEAARTRPS